MKRLFSTTYNQTFLDAALLTVRIAIASFLLTHGIPKLMMFFSDQPIAFADPLGVGVEASLAMTVFAEVFCSILLLFGFGTRLALIPLIILMSVAAFKVHYYDGFGKQELPLLYLLTYVLLFATGPGRFSLDYLISKKSGNQIPLSTQDSVHKT